MACAGPTALSTFRRDAPGSAGSSARTPPPRSAILHPVLRPLVLLTLLTTWAVAAPPPAASAADAAATLTAEVNAARQDAGLPALAVRGDLEAVAVRHSGRMADRGEIYHSNTGSEVSGWQAVGENVGRGTDLQELHDAFMASSAHRANILSSRFTEIGIGVVQRDGSYWVTQTFRRPSGSTAADSSPSDSGSADGSSTASRASAAPPAPKPAAPPAPKTATSAAAPPPTAPQPAARAPVEPVVDRLTVTLARIESLDSAEPVGTLLEVERAAGGGG